MSRWIEASKQQAARWLHEDPYPGALTFMAKQLINSDLLSTREFWRAKIGVPAEMNDSYVIPADAMMEARK